MACDRSEHSDLRNPICSTERRRMPLILRSFGTGPTSRLLKQGAEGRGIGFPPQSPRKECGTERALIARYPRWRWPYEFSATSERLVGMGWSREALVRWRLWGRRLQDSCACHAPVKPPWVRETHTAFDCSEENVKTSDRCALCVSCKDHAPIGLGQKG